MKVRNTNTFFSDFETLTHNSKTFQHRLQNGERGLSDVWLWTLLKNESEYEIGHTLDEYFDNLFNKAKTLSGSIVVYFHNLAFDGNFIFKYLMKKYPHWFIQDISDTPDKYKPYFKTFTDSNKIFSIEINYVWYAKNKSGNWKAHSKNIIFKCSYLILSSNIESLGKSLGIVKYDGVEDLIKNGDVKNVDEFYDLGDFDLKETNRKVYDVFVRYIINDTKIAYLAINNFDKTLLNQDNEDIYFYKKTKKELKRMDINIQLKNKLTIASIAFKLMVNNVYLNSFKSKFNDKNLPKHLYIYNEEQYNNAKLSYRGGFTQFNISKQLKETNKLGMSIDITSSYPYQMTKLIPYDNTRYYEKDLNSKFKYLKYYDIEIKFKIKDEYKDKMYIIPKTKQVNKLMTEEHMSQLETLRELYSLGDTKYRYPESGFGRYIVYSEELELWEKLYDIEYIHRDSFYLKSEEFLRPFIEKYYTLKEEADKEGKEALKSCYKILLNSCYGATAKRKQYNEIYATKDSLTRNEKISFGKKTKLGKVKEYNIQVEKEKQWKLGDSYLNLYELREERDITKFPNAMIASHITSLGRIQLIKTILSIGIDNFIYCDTDSIYFDWNWKDDNEMNKLRNMINLNGFELGSWKIEKKFDNMIVRGAKDYSIWYENKNIGIVMSGVKKSRQKTIATTWDKKLFLGDEIMIEDATLQRQECENGMFLIWTNKLKQKGKN